MKARAKTDNGGGHAPLPPSASSRWLKCPPSQGYIKRLIDEGVIARRIGGPAAQRGTRIHELGDRIAKELLAGKKPKRAKGVAEDEYDEAVDYAKYIVRKRDELADIYGDVTMGLEDKAILDPKFCWGQRDAWLSAGSHLCVIDLKTGREPVDPVDNSQMIIYASDIVSKYKPKTVELCIWQPNADDTREGERSYTYNLKSYLEILKKIRDGMVAAAYWTQVDKNHERELSPGDQCRWCDALGVCPAAKDRNQSISSKQFKPVKVMKEPPAPETLTPDQIAEIMRRAPEFKNWIKAIEIRALELAARGTEISGFKVVERVTRRVYSPDYTDSQVARGLGLQVHAITETKRIPISKLEKQLDAKGKEKLKKFVFKPQGLPTIVADSDRRVPMLATKINFTPLSIEEEDDA